MEEESRYLSWCKKEGYLVRLWMNAPKWPSSDKFFPEILVPCPGLSQREQEASLRSSMDLNNTKGKQDRTKTSDAGSQYRCERVGRGIQPQPRPNPFPHTNAHGPFSLIPIHTMLHHPLLQIMILVMQTSQEPME